MRSSIALERASFGVAEWAMAESELIAEAGFERDPPRLKVSQSVSAQ